jgi:CheY-like chemotaxis protein
VNELFAALRPWLPKDRGDGDMAEAPVEKAVDVVPARLREQPATFGGESFDGLRVLVVDDDYRNIFATTAVLERGNAIVTVAESGAEAITALELAPDIDIVLIDIMMPVMDGYETIRAIRQMDGRHELPIVALTGKAAEGERDRCLEAGADDYIPKPFDTGALLGVLAPWLPSDRVPVTS